MFSAKSSSPLTLRYRCRHALPSSFSQSQTQVQWRLLHKHRLRNNQLRPTFLAPASANASVTSDMTSGPTSTVRAKRAKSRSWCCRSSDQLTSRFCTEIASKCSSRLLPAPSRPAIGTLIQRSEPGRRKMAMCTLSLDCVATPNSSILMSKVALSSVSNLSKPRTLSARGLTSTRLTL